MAQILVVDDSPLVTDEVAAFFSAEGFQVATASDGREGVLQLQEDTNIRLVFVDVNMPIMDGLTMIEKVRNELKNQTVQILMLTTEEDPEMKERAKSLGVVGWIVKPFTGKTVLGFAKQLLK